MQNDLNVLTLTGTVSVNHNIAGSINIGGGGGTGNEDAILSGTWTKTSYSNSNITKLSPAFPDTVEFPNVTAVEYRACQYAIGGKYWNLPECVTVGSYAFLNNSVIISINLPKCTEISNNAFNSCTNLTTISLPKCVTVGVSAINVTKIQTLDLPECVTISNDGLRNNGFLTTVNLPKCQTIGTQAFIACNNLTSIDLPSIVTINSRAFNNSGGTLLATVVLGENIAEIGTSAFMGCTSLESFTVKATTPPTLGTGVFTNTPIAGSGTGKIYVPASAVDTYKAASGWSTYASHIEAIPSEESQGE